MCEKQKEYTIIIDEKNCGARLDVALSFALEQLSRSNIQKLIDDNQVMVNKILCNSKKTKVKSGDMVEITIPEVEPLDVLPEDIPLDIVYEDGDVLIVNKEKNRVVHPAVGNQTGTLVNAILFHCKDLSGVNGVARPGIVHRIDKDTTGLLIIAKNDFAHQSLAKQLAAHTISRAYHAIVYNNFTEEEGTINQPIGRDPKNRLRQAVTSFNGKEAVTHY
ncbi:MAG: RluA family pseudouridine synthase, partial [Anaerovorax sp.]